MAVDLDDRCQNSCWDMCTCNPEPYLNRVDVLILNLETAAAMEITRQSYYRKGWENAMAIRGICEPLEEVREVPEEKPRCTGNLVHNEYTYCPAHDR